jgi:hypothetical protein
MVLPAIATPLPRRRPTTQISLNLCANYVVDMQLTMPRLWHLPGCLRRFSQSFRRLT